MDILWKKTPLSVCILLYAVENSLFSVEKSTEFVDNPVEKTQQKGILFRGILIRKQKSEILIYKRISAFLFL